jgi:signal transduction histidine kinase
LHVRNIRRRFDAVLEERNRLAREMHDTLIQGCVGSRRCWRLSLGRDVSPQLNASCRPRPSGAGTIDEARLAI